MEGTFTDISGGGMLPATLKVAETTSEGARILCMLPDTGERYLSTPLFEGVEAAMSAVETALIRSTTGCQMP